MILIKCGVNAICRQESKSYGQCVWNGFQHFVIIAIKFKYRLSFHGGFYDIGTGRIVLWVTHAYACEYIILHIAYVPVSKDPLRELRGYFHIFYENCLQGVKPQCVLLVTGVTPKKAASGLSIPFLPLNAVLSINHEFPALPGSAFSNRSIKSCKKAFVSRIEAFSGNTQAHNRIMAQKQLKNKKKRIKNSLVCRLDIKRFCFIL